jgi:hypothetical protein
MPVKKARRQPARRAAKPALAGFVHGASLVDDLDAVRDLLALPPAPRRAATAKWSADGRVQAEAYAKAEIASLLAGKRLL